jgi:hypothetical protein
MRDCGGTVPGRSEAHAIMQTLSEMQLLTLVNEVVVGGMLPRMRLVNQVCVVAIGFPFFCLTCVTQAEDVLLALSENDPSF